MDSLEHTFNTRNIYPEGQALGRILSVDVRKRVCRIRIIMGPPNLLDKDLSEVQWLSLDVSPSGDEMTCLPRRGSIGLVSFICGEAFIFGFLKPTTREHGARTGNEGSPLNEGDKVISTFGGNRIVVKASGVIEVISTPLLRSVWYPKTSTLIHACSSHELMAAGGFQKWNLTDDTLNTCLYTAEYRKNLARTAIIVEEIGDVSLTTIKSMRMGAGLPGQLDVAIPFYEKTLSITGELVEKVGPSGVLTIEKKPTGEVNLKNAIASVNLSPAGDLDFKNAIASTSITATGDFDFKNAIASTSITAAGDFEAKNAVASTSITASGDFEVKNAVASASITAAGDFEVKNPTVDFSAAASGDILVKNKTGCTLSMETSGDITLKGPVGVLKIDKTGKIGLGGPAAELLDLFDQLLDQIDKTLDAFINQPNLCMTPAGPSSPLLPPALPNLIVVKTMIATIKGLLGAIKGAV